MRIDGDRRWMRVCLQPRTFVTHTGASQRGVGGSGPHPHLAAGAKMREVDPDPFDYGDLPEDLLKLMNDDYLLGTEDFLDPADGFLDPCWDLEELLSDVLEPSECPSSDAQPRQTDADAVKTKGRKRRRVPQSLQKTDENTPSRPKRRRATVKPRSKVSQDEPPVNHSADIEAEPLPTTPPNILHFQFITIPDSAGYPVLQTVSLSPPVLRLPETPTYILVPSTSCKQAVQPLSPVDGALVPVQKSSSPIGSLSDTTSKTLAPISPTKMYEEPAPPPPPPQSPPVFKIPELVKENIREMKVNMREACQHLEEGLSLTSHYVDVRVSQRETLCSGRNTNKSLDKELIVMGDTDREKSLLGQSQIFGYSNPKRYILLLGNAGMGKTTLIRKLCLDWARDCVPQFDFVFLLDGKTLDLKEPVYSLQTLLLSVSTSCTNPDAVFAQILAAPKRVLVVFDGFEELRHYELLFQAQEKELVTSLQKDRKAESFTVSQLYSAILQRLLLPGCTLLLTMRPRGSANQLLRRADSFLEVRGFTPADVETYLCQYFSDPALKASALDCLRNCNYLRLLCWNPGLCRLVCSVLERCNSNSEVLPRTLTGLCHRVLCLKFENDRRGADSEAEEKGICDLPDPAVRKSRSQDLTCTRKRRTRGAKKLAANENEVEVKGALREEEREMLSQLSPLAWEGVKENSSFLPKGLPISARLEAFGLRTGLFLSQSLRGRSRRGLVDEGGGGKENQLEVESGRTDIENLDPNEDRILKWANPFLQSYLAGVHLSLSRTNRTFLQILPFQSGLKGRRRPHREEMELTQQCAVGLLFHDRTDLQKLQAHTEASFRETVQNKQALVVKHLEGLSPADLSPAQVLEACHYVYEAGFTSVADCTRFIEDLATNLPPVLSFHGVPLNPPDVLTVQKVLERGGGFCLDLGDSGIGVSGLRALVGLDNINTYRACIADVITLWEQLEQSGEVDLLRGAVSKFKIHPLKLTQVCHVEHLAKLVNIHVSRRLSDRSTGCDSILAEGVPAVRELHKLDYELGPEKGPLGLTKLLELLPGLHNLQHLDLENSKMGDKGSEKLAIALLSLRSLEVLNLSQNCIGDHTMRTLAAAIRDLPKLRCLSLYSNVISDGGVESLAGVLPHMVSLTDVDVKYNKLTDVGAQSLAASLRNCPTIKTLWMWNQCIPFGVFERLQQQDSRILCH